MSVSLMSFSSDFSRNNNSSSPNVIAYFLALISKWFLSNWKAKIMVITSPLGSFIISVVACVFPIHSKQFEGALVVFTKGIEKSNWLKRVICQSADIQVRRSEGDVEKKRLWSSPSSHNQLRCSKRETWKFSCVRIEIFNEYHLR